MQDQFGFSNFVSQHFPCWFSKVPHECRAENEGIHLCVPSSWDMPIVLQLYSRSPSPNPAATLAAAKVFHCQRSWDEDQDWFFNGWTYIHGSGKNDVLYKAEPTILKVRLTQGLNHLVDLTWLEFLLYGIWPVLQHHTFHIPFMSFQQECEEVLQQTQAVWWTRGAGIWAIEGEKTQTWGKWGWTVPKTKGEG